MYSWARPIIGSDFSILCDNAEFVCLGIKPNGVTVRRDLLENARRFRPGKESRGLLLVISRRLGTKIPSVPLEVVLQLRLVRKLYTSILWGIRLRIPPN